jgi:hypothetical protein
MPTIFEPKAIAPAEHPARDVPELNSLLIFSQSGVWLNTSVMYPGSPPEK